MVAAMEPGRWYYRCGALLLELPGDEPGLGGSWRACEPCRRPPVRRILEALGSMPDCPLDAAQLHRLRSLVVDGRWV